MTLAAINFATATASNLVYTMNPDGFRDFLFALTRIPVSADTDDNLLRHIRIARRIIASDFCATPRQWSMMQSAFDNRELTYLVAGDLPVGDQEQSLFLTSDGTLGGEAEARRFPNSYSASLAARAIAALYPQFPEAFRIVTRVSIRPNYLATLDY